MSDAFGVSNVAPAAENESLLERKFYRLQGL
jgi:hypothetical protein